MKALLFIEFISSLLLEGKIEQARNELNVVISVDYKLMYGKPLLTKLQARDLNAAIDYYELTK